MDERSQTCQEVLAFVRRGGILILGGQYWDVLYKLLPPTPDGKRAPRPLILAAEHLTGDKEKHEKLIEHILWAEQYGGIEQAARYLFDLPAAHYKRAEEL